MASVHTYWAKTGVPNSFNGEGRVGQYVGQSRLVHHLGDAQVQFLG
jgi:hypothetical protein